MPRTLRVPAVLLAPALAGWVASAVAMQGMSSMGGPGPAASFLRLWLVMSTAMMPFEIHGTCAFTRDFDYAG